MATPPNQQEEEEQIVFSSKYIIELSEKRKYNYKFHEWFSERDITINGEQVNVNAYRSYKGLLKSIAKKISILQDMNDEEGKKMIRKDILVDIANLIYKLERGDNE